MATTISDAGSSGDTVESRDAIATAAGVGGDETAAERRELKRKIARATLQGKLRALLLVAPLLVFVIISFVVPIGQMLFRSVDDPLVSQHLPRTAAALEAWDPAESDLPPDAAFAAIIEDLREASAARAHTRVGSRLNYETPGISSLFRRTPRQIAPRSASRLAAVDERIAEEGARAVLIDVDEDWGAPEVWRTIQRFSSPYTSGYFLSAMDLQTGSDGVEWKPENEQIYVDLFIRTLFLSVVITVSTLLLGYPIAYLLATLPMRTSNLLLILVLLPFWTSLLVRTSAWIVLLQTQGVVNDVLVFSGLNGPIYDILTVFVTPDTVSLCQDQLNQIIAAGVPTLELFLAQGENFSASACAQEVLAIFQQSGGEAALARAAEIQADGETNGFSDVRFTMIFNQTGTIVAMTHILLPFMILPLYSVMKTIPPSYVRAAKSLGASNVTAFWRVYLPNTIPGIGAGAILVFILAIGYYITPELVGGTEGVFISNRIAFHIRTSLNWGLAAALGALLLVAVLILYYVYDRIVGIDNVKLG